MTKDEFIAAVAKLVAGLQVPVSMPGNSRPLLGAAYEPWAQLLHEVNGGFGWTTAEDCERVFRKVVAS